MFSSSAEEKLDGNAVKRILHLPIVAVQFLAVLDTLLNSLEFVNTAFCSKRTVLLCFILSGHHSAGKIPAILRKLLYLCAWLRSFVLCFVVITKVRIFKELSMENLAFFISGARSFVKC